MTTQQILLVFLGLLLLVVAWKAIPKRGTKQQPNLSTNPSRATVSGSGPSGSANAGAGGGGAQPAAVTVQKGPSNWPKVLPAILIAILVGSVLWWIVKPIGTRLDRWAVSSQVEKVERQNPEEQIASNDRVNQHIIRCLTESYGLPKAGVEKLLAGAGGTPNEKFRQELFYKFGVQTPTDWGRLPRWPRAVPIGTTVEYTFTLKPGETSQVFAMLGVWAITIEPTDRSMSMDLDYILDPGQPYGKTVQYRPLPTKQNRYLDPATGKEVDGAARNTYQVALPQGYIIPCGKDGVEFKVIMVRERNPDFNE